MDIAKVLQDAVEAGAVPGVAAAATTDKGVSSRYPCFPR